MTENIAQGIIPLIIFTVVLASLLFRRETYENFIKGAAKGLKITVELIPTLIGLMVGVGILRESGLISDLCGMMAKSVDMMGIKVSESIIDVIPVGIVKIFSSSAATGLMLDIFRVKGADSQSGRLAALLLASTETILYTVSVYCMSVRVTKTRWIIPGALVAMTAGMAASGIIVFFLWK